MPAEWRIAAGRKGGMTTVARYGAGHMANNNQGRPRRPRHSDKGAGQPAQRGGRVARQAKGGAANPVITRFN